MVAAATKYASCWSVKGFAYWIRETIKATARADGTLIVLVMTTLLELIAIVVPVVGVAFASQRWGAEQRPGIDERHPERSGERWAIR